MARNISARPILACSPAPAPRLIVSLGETGRRARLIQASRPGGAEKYDELAREQLSSRPTARACKWRTECRADRSGRHMLAGLLQIVRLVSICPGDTDTVYMSEYKRKIGTDMFDERSKRKF